MNNSDNSIESTKLPSGPSKSSELWKPPNPNSTITPASANKSSSLNQNNIGHSDNKVNNKKNKIDKTINELDSVSTGVDDCDGPRGTLVISQKNSVREHSFSRSKNRSNNSGGSGGNNRYEIRMARGNNNNNNNNSNNNSQRGSTRGRFFKKNQHDRDYECGYQRFQEPLRDQDSGQNKYYDAKRSSDESRITKILKRLCREEDDDNFLSLSKQVLERCIIPENQRSIKRNMEQICECLLEALYICSDAEAQDKIVKGFAAVGYILYQDFKRYLNWLFDKYSNERKDEIKCILLTSLSETLKMDLEAQKLKDYSMSIMSRLQSILENVDRPDLLIATVDVILIVIDSYPNTFSNYFRDAVDILVGWHIDFTQTKSVINYASRSLQKFHSYWIADLQFTVTLLSQFLEDMESYDEELIVSNNSGKNLRGEESPPPGPGECILRITSLISVFNTVFKSVGEHLSPNVNPIVQWDFLIDYLSKMLKTVIKAVELSDFILENEESSIDNLVEYIKNLHLSPKNIEILMKKVKQNGISDEKCLLKMIKSLTNEKKQDDTKADRTKEKKENEKIYVRKNKDNVSEENDLINLCKLIEMKKERKKMLDITQEKEELILVANECAHHLLGLLQTRINKNHDLLFYFIDLQLNKLNIFQDKTIISTLNIISKVIKEVSANLSLDLVHKLLDIDSPIHKLRFKNSINIQNSILNVYHSLLGLKNIPLLQEAYRYILGDLEVSYKLIIKDFDDEFITSNPLNEMAKIYSEKNAEFIIIFLLQAISDLANASNSIIGMWALKPSILELLAVKMKPYDDNLLKISPLVQYSILYLLYSHCSRYNHFIPSSNLISGSTNLCHPIDIFPGNMIDVPTTSPTSKHLSTILNLINNCFQINIPEKTFLLLSNWIQEIFSQAENYMNILKESNEFQLIIKTLLNCGSTTNYKISLEIYKCLNILMSDKKVIWPESIYNSVIELIILHLSSFDSNIRQKYGNLLLQLPIDIVISDINKQYPLSETKKLLEIPVYSTEFLAIAQKLYMRTEFNNNNNDSNNQNINTTSTSTTTTITTTTTATTTTTTTATTTSTTSTTTTTTITPTTTTSNSNSSNNNHQYGLMKSNYFKIYMAFLLQNYNFNASELSEIFTLCWPTIIHDNKVKTKMYDFGLKNQSFLYFWSGYEAAYYCIINKLRTPLGKPQETFTSIEVNLKKLAHHLTKSNDNKCEMDKSKILLKKNGLNNDSLNEHIRVRLFVDFLEQLEKLIYNAANGCAVSISPLPKSVRTFFITNKLTCREWLHRMRLAICIVALNAGLATDALRNGQCLLQDLHSSHKETTQYEIQNATLCTVQALVALKEAEALKGLYVYINKELGKNYLWLKGAMEESFGHYEYAIDIYKSLLTSYSDVKKSKLNETPGIASEENIKTDDNDHAISFVIKRLAYCYSIVGNWNELIEFNYHTDLFKNDNNIIFNSQIDSFVKKGKCLKMFEDNQKIIFEELSNWQLLDKTSPKTSIDWSYTVKMMECSNTLTNVALKIYSNDNDSDNSLNIQSIKYCKEISGKIIEESLRNMPSEYLNDSIIIQYCAQSLENVLNNKKITTFDILNEDKIKKLGTNISNQILWWSNYFNNLSDDNIKSTSLNNSVSNFRLNLIKNARKENNFKLAKGEIIKYFIDEGIFNLTRTDDLVFENITDKILMNNDELNIQWNKNNMKALKEVSKLLFSMKCYNDAIKVSSITSLGISKTIVSNNNDESSNNELRKMGTKLILKLTKWIQNQDEIDINNNTQLIKLLKFESIHNDGLMDKLFGRTTEFIPKLDIIIGKLIQLSVNQCPDLSSGWENLADWCYKWGCKISNNIYSYSITVDDFQKIIEYLPTTVNEEDYCKIKEILNDACIDKNSKIDDECDIEVVDIKSLELIENQVRQELRQLPSIKNLDDEVFDKIIDAWYKDRKKIYSYYELSANAYFKFIELSDYKSNNCTTITATLRLLKLIVKYPSELKNMLEKGLSTTPTQPWKEIIPQLFSRLSHPESYVRTRIFDLLCRIAKVSPHLITFPAVVGSLSDNNVYYYKNDDEISIDEEDDDDNENENENEPEHDQDNDNDDDELLIPSNKILKAKKEMNPKELQNDIHSNDDESKNFLDLCFNQLSDYLSNEVKDSVDHVKIFIKELRRITLLWDELWLKTMVHYLNEIFKKFHQLVNEVQKVVDNTWLNNEEKEKLLVDKYRIILKPIIFILDNLMAITSVPPETPHERKFQEKYNPLIEETINRLKHPKNLLKPQLTFASFKLFLDKLVLKVNKRAISTLNMKDISPVLANMKDTSIAMPGVSANDKSKIIRIRSVDNNVQILPTKTRPKKLIFYGSDGHAYTYLFKGLEDLHLDERIMQFLNICNKMMSKDNDMKKLYRARHYSVIPLGPRSGLIQWVDGVIPLFTLYKRWQQREGITSRPSELFYNKLTPLLAMQQIPVENRKEWPLYILKNVLDVLINQTPDDLLSKEIWCNSTNAGNWWQATKRYSYSVAVMSIIGYIIGLGDRHLDNVLIDLNTGEIVHIDYNVCFEKGKSLRVPEKVPFRLTQNITKALGFSGVEGIFRLACEHTLSVMRSGRETLLTLLEAFVYDPLVDWRAGAENTIANYGACYTKMKLNNIVTGKKQMEKEVTKAMFSIRIIEMKTQWINNRNLLINVLPKLANEINNWSLANDDFNNSKDLLYERHKQLSLIKESQAMGQNHSLHDVIERYNTHKSEENLIEQLKLPLKNIFDECQKHISMHKIAFKSIKSKQIVLWMNECNSLSNIKEYNMIFDLVKEFLQNAGQNQMIIQCEQSEQDLIQLATQQSLLMRNCLDLLTQYSAVCALYPMSIINQHRSIVYYDWASKLLNNDDLVLSREALQELESNIKPIDVNDIRVKNIADFSYKIQILINDINEKYKKYYEKMLANEGLPESQLRIEQAYNDTIIQINTFINTENNANKALECININNLCSLNKRILMMEGAAKCAGECLVDLTSRDGDWFLDEMRQMSSLIVENINLIPFKNHHDSLDNDDDDDDDDGINNDVLISRAFDCLKNCDSIYKGLQEFNYNFHMIILPEGLKTVITEETSVVSMINDINHIVKTIDLSLDDITEQLEAHLRFILMEMDSPHSDIQNIVQELKLMFNNLSTIEDNQDGENLTSGQMLLMGFNGLFEKLQVEGNMLINSLSDIDVPINWKKIDQIRDAKEISVPIFNEKARRIIDDIFFVKKLKTMYDFFSMCYEIGNSFKSGNNPVKLYDDEQLNRPIKLFTADYVSRLLLGVTSQILAITTLGLLQRMGLNVNEEIEQRDIGAENKVSIEELSRKMLDVSLKNSVFSGSILAQSNALINTLENIWRRKQNAKISQKNVEICSTTLQRLQLQYTAYSWIHEDILVLSRSNFTNINPLNRSTFMLELRKKSSTLSNIELCLCELREQQKQLISSVNSRLKWAAGANPALIEVLSAFDNAILILNDKLSRQRNLSNLITTTCDSILHYEALRTRTCDSVTLDTKFINLVKQRQENYVKRLMIKITTKISYTELNLVELLIKENQLGTNIDNDWLKRTEKLLSDVIIDNQKSHKDKMELLEKSSECLKDCVNELRNILKDHFQLMTDIRGLIKTMLKQQNIYGLEEFLTEYQTFIENITALIKKLKTDPLVVQNVTAAQNLLNNLIPKVPFIYNELLEFTNDINFVKPKSSSSDVSISNKKRGLLMEPDIQQQTESNAVTTPRKTTLSIKDLTNEKGIQKMNAYALSVWRRVKMKLEGRDPSKNSESTIEEQVDYVIREALDIANLALIYEGWTPWV